MAEAEKERNNSFLERSGLLFSEDEEEDDVTIDLDIQDADRNINSTHSHSSLPHENQVERETPFSKSITEHESTILDGFESVISSGRAFESSNSKIIQGNTVGEESAVSDVSDVNRSLANEQKPVVCQTKNNYVSGYEHKINHEKSDLATGILRLNSLANDPSDMLSAVCISSPNKRRKTDCDSANIAANTSASYASITQDSGYETSLCSSMQVDVNKASCCKQDNILNESGYIDTRDGSSYKRLNVTEMTESGFCSISLDLNCDKNRLVEMQGMTEISCCHNDDFQVEMVDKESDSTNYTTHEHHDNLRDLGPSTHCNQGREVVKPNASLCNKSLDSCHGDKKKDNVSPGDDLCCYEHDSCPPSQIKIQEEDKLSAATEIKFNFQKPIDFYRSYQNLINALK